MDIKPALVQVIALLGTGDKPSYDSIQSTDAYMRHEALMRWYKHNVLTMNW